MEDSGSGGMGGAPSCGVGVVVDSLGAYDVVLTGVDAVEDIGVGGMGKDKQRARREENSCNLLPRHLVKELHDDRRAQRDNCHLALVQRPILMGSNAISGRVLVDQRVVGRGVAEEWRQR